MATFEVTVVQVKSFQANLKIEAATAQGAERQALYHLTKTPSDMKDWHQEPPLVTWIRKLNSEK